MSGYPYGSGSYAGVPPGSSPYASPYAQAVGGPGPGPSGSTSQRTSHRQSTGVHHAPNQLPSYQQAQLSSKLSIHDPKAFSASSVQVEMYLKERLSLCVGANSDSQLPRFVTTCLQQRSTRIVHVNTQQLVSIDVGGQFGLRFRIADLYTALGQTFPLVNHVFADIDTGFIVSETDPYPYTLQETLKQLCEIHLRILAVYEKWITTLSQRFNGNQEVPPNTACLMWRTRTRPDGSWTYVMGLFPNLATNEMIFRCKEQARQIVQDSLQAAFANINVEPPSPRELNEPHSGLIGECAEILALLYLLESDPALINGLEIYGLSANLFVDAVRNMLSYNRDKFRSFLKGACRNCRHVIDRIDDNGPLPADPQTAALRYFDMATRSAQENWDQRPPPIPDPQQKPSAAKNFGIAHPYVRPEVGTAMPGNVQPTNAVLTSAV
ncbi:hypothetical protein MIND_00770100 [Mycena indigotica]|uniref:Uncharacterized protein n=1 Tax=Mycena indigotica TaxID=2126181 RepID=A0A8H6SPK6_9AGAR|nr:uncharacterized protein MIND_00770100 [Mycena indigotica]KAF7302037.1 hypothetical protein MIND_00770100 [Mycena indigotica]